MAAQFPPSPALSFALLTVPILPPHSSTWPSTNSTRSRGRPASGMANGISVGGVSFSNSFTTVVVYCTNAGHERPLGPFPVPLPNQCLGKDGGKLGCLVLLVALRGSFMCNHSHSIQVQWDFPFFHPAIQTSNPLDSGLEKGSRKWQSLPRHGGLGERFGFLNLNF